MNSEKRDEQAWTTLDSSETFGIDRWGSGYFGVSDEGDLTVLLNDVGNGEPTEVSLPSLIGELNDRGIPAPLLLRFPQILEGRIRELNGGFADAISDLNYEGDYRGVLPIKVNQQQQVAEEVSAFGQQFHYGFEAGSKPELICALAYLKDPEALLICNGYKDEEFINLALHGQMMGLRVILVLEMFSELELIKRCAKKMGIEPAIGIRVKLAAAGSGQWSGSAGEQSPFGLNLGQVIETVEYLKNHGELSWLQMLHCHQGSQIPDLTIIRRAVEEAAWIYSGLIAEGAPMGLLNLGGGLAVDYDGSRSTRPNSSNYSIREYCQTIVDAVQWVAERNGVTPPTIVTESGRAVVAHYSMLAVEILDVSPFENHLPTEIEDDAPGPLADFSRLSEKIGTENLLEIKGKAVRYQEELHELFLAGEISLRQRAICEQIYWHTLTQIARASAELRFPPRELREISSLLADQCYGNFSLFQSLADSWAIDSVFPIAPLQRLDERPSRSGVIHDVTCDCDGMVKRYAAHSEIRESLPIHRIDPGDGPYYLGIFLVGAYQETLSDLHNLFGDTHAVSVEVEEGRIKFSREVEGDSVADVLSYVEHDPRKLTEQFRALAEQAIREERITPAQRKTALDAYREGLSGYTYFEL